MRQVMIMHMDKPERTHYKQASYIIHIYFLVYAMCFFRPVETWYPFLSDCSNTYQKMAGKHIGVLNIHHFSWHYSKISKSTSTHRLKKYTLKSSLIISKYRNLYSISKQKHFRCFQHLKCFC